MATLTMVKRIPQLDALRAIAVLLVICYHAHILPFGWIGVDLFFVLSGFLISGLLFSEWKASRSIKLGRFFLRRGLKIYPAFYCLVAVMALFVPNHNYLHDILFIQNYYAGWSPIAHDWSLAVEEHFYLLLPITVLFLGKTNRMRLIPAISCALLLVCLIARFISPALAQFATHCRIDALFVGVALGYLYHFHTERFDAIALNRLTLLGIFLVLPSCALSRSSLATVTLGLLLNSIGFAFLLARSVRSQWRFLAFEQIGQYSYSIYLWHLLVIALCPTTFVGRILMVVFSISIGIAMSLIIEMPILKARERLALSANEGMRRFPATTRRSRNGYREGLTSRQGS